MREYVSKVELGYSWSVDFFSAGDKQCCFGAVMVGDGEYGVKAPRFRELGDEVKGDCFKGKGVLWFDWVEGVFSLVCVCLVCLALSAALHIVNNKLLHVRPPCYDITVRSDDFFLLSVFLLFFAIFCCTILRPLGTTPRVP